MSRFADMSDSSPYLERPSGCGSRIRFLSETDSTNRQARLWAASGAPDAAVVVADHQASGRGRFERTWQSSPGQNLLLTLILRRKLPRPGLLPLAAGVAVHACVADLVPASVRVKWPNDVRIEGRKVAGVLVEAPGDDVYLVGVGLNVNESDFPDGLSGQPTSLLLETGRRHDRADVFDRLMRAFDQALSLLETGTLLDAYRSHLEGVGQVVTLQDGRSGRLEGVDGSGGLVMATETGRIVVHSGDVSLRAPSST